MRAWLVVLSVAGCEEDEDAAPGSGDPSGPDAWPGGVEIGTGEVGFAPLDDGDPVAFLTAGQGGAHVEVAGRVTGMSDKVAVRPVITLAETGEPVTTPGDTYIALVDFDAATCKGVFYGVRALLDLSAVDPCALEGEALDVSVEVENLVTGDVVADGVIAVGTLTSGVSETFCE